MCVPGSNCAAQRIVVSQYAIGGTRVEVPRAVTGPTSTDDESRERDRLGTLRIGDAAVDGVERERIATAKAVQWADFKCFADE